MYSADGGNDIQDFPSSSSYPSNSYVTLKYVKQGNTISVYSDNTLIGSKTYNWINTQSTVNLRYNQWGSSTIYVKNIKVKPL